MIRLICLLTLSVAALAKNKTIEPLVIGGIPAKENEFPYQVSVQLDGKHYCGGALVSLRHVVTSASCLAVAYKYNEENGFGSLTVLAGTISTSKGGTRYNVAKYAAHPNYAWYNKDFFSADYDIGVIQLAETVQTSESIKPIPLDVSGFEKDLEMTFTGWGRKEAGGPKNELVLHFASLEYINKEKCQEYFDFPVKSRHICNTPERGIGGCTSDVGGPLVSDKKLIGILTRLRGCGSRKLPDIYISVAYHAHFLLEMIKDGEEE